ncbi:MAG: serine/threonine protein kinase [Deltaproteobacteria bacterium]|nr:serine/threonine protein kinase [Deltaproteobacteria bacterium]
MRATLYPEVGLVPMLGWRVVGALVLGLMILALRRPGLTRRQIVWTTSAFLGLTVVSLAALAELFGGLTSAYVFSLAYLAVAVCTYLPARWSEMIAIIGPSTLCFLGALVVAVALSDQHRAQLSDAHARAVFVTHAVLIVGLAAFAAASGHFHWRARQALDDARRLGRYRLLRLLGEGGMNQVWLARDDGLKREVALKILRTEPAQDGTLSDRRRRRFEREAQATSALTSPHTVRVYDHGMNDDGVSWIAMEALHGLDLDQLVAHHGPLDPRRAIHFIRQAAASLAEAHGSGLVHRDIKPANLFVLADPPDFLKVVDFGIARQLDAHETSLTLVGMLIGTPAFMAPELFLGHEADARSDVYALGATLYVVLTGELPVQITDLSALASAHAQPPTPPSERVLIPFDPSYRDALDGLVLRCLSPRREDRPADGLALSALVEALPIEAWTEREAVACWSTHRGLFASDDSTPGAPTR